MCKLSLLQWDSFPDSLTVSWCDVGALLTCHPWERGSCFDSQKTDSCQQLWCSTAQPTSQPRCHNHQWQALSVLCLSLPLLPLSVQLHRGSRFFINYFLSSARPVGADMTLWRHTAAPPTPWQLISSFKPHEDMAQSRPHSVNLHIPGNL